MDVGAFQGAWSRVCADIFPEATITCIEPQEPCQEVLRSFAASRENIRVIPTLLGSTDQQKVPFPEIGSGSSLLLDSANRRSNPMTTIDRLIQDGICKPPELLKLDVQGYEVEVLKGWTLGFEHCQVIQSEISLLPIVEGAPLLHELVYYLYQRGFVMFDVDELIRAPSDGTVWQVDAIFCRKDSLLRTDRLWRT